MKQAVILSGGFGKRLSSVVEDVPKPMAPVSGKPFLDYIIDLLKKNGFDNFVFLTGYKSEIIENYYKNLNNAVFIRETAPLGTGGAILNAFNGLNDEFFVINGDTYFDFDYSLVSDFAKDKDAVIALKYTNNFERYGFVETNNEYKVVSFIEKKSVPADKIDGYINSGVYYLKKSVLKPFADKYNNKFLSLENDIFPKLSDEKQLYGLPVGGYFIDIGIPEDYFKAQTEIIKRLSSKRKPALFVDKDGTIIENTGYPSGKEFTIIDKTINIVKHYFDKNYYIVMVTNQAGIAKGKFSLEEMNAGINAVKHYYYKFGVIFDDIEYCPYHKDGIIKKYSYDTLLRKPAPGMLLKACDKLNTDLKNSLMLGDNPEIDNINLPYIKCEIIKR